MQILKRRLEKLRQRSGYNAALARLSNAAFLLGYEKELAAAHSFHEKVEVIERAFQVEAGHKVVNLLRHKAVLPPLSYRNILRRAARDLKVPLLKGESAESIEAKVVTAHLGLRHAWEPADPDHRERLKNEINRAMRELKTDIKSKLARAMSTALTLRSLKVGVKGLPVWAKRGTMAGIVATGLYGAYKLGEPDYTKSILPCILLFALIRADLELSMGGNVDPKALEQRA